MGHKSFLGFVVTCSQTIQNVWNADLICALNLQPPKGVNWSATLELTLQHRDGFHSPCELSFGHLKNKILQNEMSSSKSANSHLFLQQKIFPDQSCNIRAEHWPAAPHDHQPLRDGQCQAALKSLSSLLNPHGCFSFASRTYRISNETKEQSLLWQCLHAISKKRPVDLKSAWKKKMLFILSLPEHWYSQKHYFNEVFTCHWVFSLCSRVVSLMCRLNLSSHRGSSRSVNSVSFADPIMCHNSRVKIALHKYSSSIFQVFTFHSAAAWPCLPLSLNNHYCWATHLEKKGICKTKIPREHWMHGLSLGQVAIHCNL